MRTPVSMVYYQDNLVGMRKLPTGYFDLVIDDPPYGIKQDGRKQVGRRSSVVQRSGNRSTVRVTHEAEGWDDKPPAQEYFDELFRVSKRCIIWGENYLQFTQKGTSSGRIVWDKVNAGSDQSDCEIAWTNCIKTVRQLEYMWNGMHQGKSLAEGRVMQGNKALNEVRLQPGQKPVLLYLWALLEFAQAGWRIGDFHLGSGSHRIAAWNLGLDFYAWENRLPNYLRQDWRFRNYTSQQSMFAPGTLHQFKT